MTTRILISFLLLSCVGFAPVATKAQDANADAPVRETNTQTSSDGDDAETPAADTNAATETPTPDAEAQTSSDSEMAAPAPESSHEAPAHDAPVDANSSCWQYGTAKASKCFTKQSYK